MSSNLGLGFSEVNLRMDKPPVQKIYEFEDFRFDAEHLMLYRRGEAIPLAPKAAETLLVFIERRGQILSKEELIEQIWPDAFVEESNLFLYLSVLRKTLGNQKSGTPYLETLRRRGYRFNGSVQLVSDNNRQEPHSTQFQVMNPIDSFRSPLADSRSVNDLPTDPSVWRQINPAVNDLPESRRDWPLRRSSFAAIGVIALVAALALSYTYFFSRRSINSIAVMPFVNESGDAELEYLSDGMTEELIGSLSRLPKLNVKARSSVFRYKGKETDAATIGRELNVQAILNGRVVQRGDGLTLYLELVDAQTGNRIWGDQYIRKQTDIISLQSEIARNVVDKLKVKLSGANEQKLVKNYTENVEAYQLFLMGRFHWRKLTKPEIEKGIVYMQRAVDADPSYALAYVGIAEAYRALAIAVEMPPGEIWPRAKAASQMAVDIDGDLAEGHSGLGSAIFFNDWNWAEAENHFLRALELDANSSMAHFGYADFLNRMGRGEESLAEIKRAINLDPLSAFLNAFEAAHLVAKEPDAAMDRVRIAIDLDPNFYFAHMIAGGVYRRKQMYPEAIAEYRLAKQLSPDQTWSDAIGLVPTLIQTGKPDEARAILDEMLRLSKSRFVPPYNVALVYNALGEKDQALAWLEKGYQQRDPRMTFLKTGPSWKDLRGDPRFAALMERMHFPE